MMHRCPHCGAHLARSPAPVTIPALRQPSADDWVHLADYVRSAFARGLLEKEVLREVREGFGFDVKFLDVQRLARRLETK